MKVNQVSQGLLVLVLLSTLLAGCGAMPVLGSAMALGSSAAVGAPSTLPADNGDLCVNELAPIKKGASWTYTNTGVYSTPINVTTTITSVRRDGFTVATHFDDNMTADQEWGCTPDGLVARSLGSAQATLGLSMHDMTASFVSTEPAGITLPVRIEDGKKWQYALKVNGNVQQGNTYVQVSGRIATDLSALGMESVTVPAGTFSARKVLAKSTITIDANVYGLDVPITSVVNSVLWFAPGVGWVKSSQTGDLPGLAINSTTQLQSYSIP